MKSPLILICLAVSTLFAQFASTSPLNAGEMKRILVLGDSLSQAFRLKPGEAYPALIVGVTMDRAHESVRNPEFVV